MSRRSSRRLRSDKFPGIVIGDPVDLLSLCLSVSPVSLFLTKFLIGRSFPFPPEIRGREKGAPMAESSISAAGDSAQITCFTEDVHDVALHFQIIRLQKQVNPRVRQRMQSSFFSSFRKLYYSLFYCIQKYHLLYFIIRLRN